MTRRHSLAEYAKALKENDGLIAPTARAMGLSYEGVDDRVKRSPELQQLRADIDRDLVETAVSNVAKGVKAGDPDYTKLVLKKKGAKYGYGPDRFELGVDVEAIRAAIREACGKDIVKLKALRAAIC